MEWLGVITIFCYLNVALLTVWLWSSFMTNVVIERFFIALKEYDESRYDNEYDEGSAEDDK